MMKTFFFFCLLYIVVLAFNGYPYGHGGHTEELSYAKFLFQDQNVYLNDFYIQNTASHIPNERYVFAKTINLLTSHSDWLVFIGHFLVSFFAFFGIFSIAKKYLNNIYSSYILVFVLFLPFSRFSFGANYLYNNEIVSGSVGSMLAIWALYFFLQEKHHHFVLLSVLATFFHAIVGVQTFMLCTITSILNHLYFQNKKLFEIKKTIIGSSIIYGIIITPFLYLLFQNFHKNEINNILFYEIISFRLPHHFIPSMFRYYHYVMVLSLLIFALYYFYKKNTLFFTFFIVFLLFLAPYTIATDFFRSPIFFFTQWTRASILLIPIGLIAVFSFLESSKFYQILVAKGEKILTLSFLLLSIISITYICISEKSPLAESYNFPFKKYKNDKHIEIAILAKEKIIQSDALFIQPASVCTLKYFGEKSSFVDMLAFPHGKTNYANWYERIKKVYKFDLSSRDYAKSIYQQADENFYNLRESDFQKLHNENKITHVLTKKEHSLNFHKIVENQDYIIYEINSTLAL